MARWRIEALRRLPELRKDIESSETIMAFWIEAFSAFRRSYEQKPSNESFILRIYSFADWCIDAPRNSDAGRDPSTAAVVCFYEHIPTVTASRDDMPRWFTCAEVKGNKAVFSYHIGEDGYQTLLQLMQRNQQRYVERRSQVGKP